MPAGSQGFANLFQKPLGYQQYTSLASATNLASIPANATNAVIAVEGAGIRWRDDGTAPTASVGMPVTNGQTFAYQGNLAAIQFIGTGATINVTYFA